MSGRRLLDAAKLFNASKSIAKQHINLRSQQLDVYSKTSTVAKAVKNQTDRITLTVQAAAALSKRFNDAPPTYATESTAAETKDSRNGDIPRKETVERPATGDKVKDGLEQDHHYTGSEQNGAAAPVVDHELPVKQEQADQNPLPDGTIPTHGTTLQGDVKGKDTFSHRQSGEPPTKPLVEENDKSDDGIRPVASRASTIPLPSEQHHLSPNDARKLQRESENQIPSISVEMRQPAQPSETEKLTKGHDKDIFYSRSNETKPEFSSLPRSKIPKHTEDVQEGDDHVPNGQMNQDVFYSTREPKQEQSPNGEITQEVPVPEQDQLPESVNTAVFRTARVAKMLGGNPYAAKPDLKLKQDSKTPEDYTKLAEGRPRENFDVRSSEQTAPAAPVTPLPSEHAKKEQEMHELASELAKDVDATSTQTKVIMAIP